MGMLYVIQVQGDNEPTRDLGAVQRGDPEMEQKMNRVIRGCLEMEVNPIMALHDQGAGGNGMFRKVMETLPWVGRIEVPVV